MPYEHLWETPLGTYGFVRRMSGLLEGIFAGMAAQHVIRKIQQDKVREALEEGNFEEAIERADGSDLDVLVNAGAEYAEKAGVPLDVVNAKFTTLNPKASFPARD